MLVPFPAIFPNPHALEMQKLRSCTRLNTWKNQICYRKMTLCHDCNIFPDELQHFIDMLCFHLTCSVKNFRELSIMTPGSLAWLLTSSFLTCYKKSIWICESKKALWVGGVKSGELKMLNSFINNELVIWIVKNNYLRSALKKTSLILSNVRKKDGLVFIVLHIISQEIPLFKYWSLVCASLQNWISFYMHFPWKIFQVLISDTL